MAKKRRPPAITRRALIHEDVGVRQAKQLDRYYSTEKGRQFLTGLKPRDKKRLEGLADVDAHVNRAAAMVGLSAEQALNRAIWRPSKGGRVYTVDAAAVVLEVSPKRLYNLLSLHRSLFRPRYRRAKDHPRRIRVLSGSDLHVLQKLKHGRLRHDASTGKYVKLPNASFTGWVVTNTMAEIDLHDPAEDSENQSS